jgi:hypothetical protein
VCILNEACLNHYAASQGIFQVLGWVSKIQPRGLHGFDSVCVASAAKSRGVRRLKVVGRRFGGFIWDME